MVPELKDYLGDVEQTFKRTLSFDYGKLPEKKIQQFKYVTAPHISTYFKLGQGPKKHMLSWFLMDIFIFCFRN